mmetsp:Transcript_21771/g.53751  ORF Transcript_21771/g.53751 Transcript_21771/m.53751 type:complete len:206 (-) Transcript_21771:1713-2330(-)
MRFVNEFGSNMSVKIFFVLHEYDEAMVAEPCGDGPRKGTDESPVVIDPTLPPTSHIQVSSKASSSPPLCPHQTTPQPNVDSPHSRRRQARRRLRRQDPRQRRPHRRRKGLRPALHEPLLRDRPRGIPPPQESLPRHRRRSRIPRPVRRRGDAAHRARDGCGYRGACGGAGGRGGARGGAAGGGEGAQGDRGEGRGGAGVAGEAGD